MKCFSRFSRSSLFALLILFPAVSLAAVQAGFPAQSIWLSKTHATAGESVRISAVVYNAGSEKLEGTLDFLVDEKSVGSKKIAVDAGASSIESLSWTSTAGNHSFAASITSDSALANAKTGSVTLAVAEPPPAPTALAAAAVSNVVNTVMASSSPISGIVQVVAEQTEAARQAGENYFAARVAADTKKAAPNSNVKGFAAGGSLANAAAGSRNSDSEDILGIQTERADAGASWWDKIVGAFDGFGLLIFSSAAFFYPFLALLIFIILFILGQRMRRGYHER